MNYYERHIGDYLKDTAHLSLLEHGVYTRLLDVYYTREGGIPEADASRLIGARSRDERAALKAVLGEFFELRDGLHVQDRSEREIERYQGKRAKAKASADARWGDQRAQSERNANASSNDDAPSMRTHTERNALDDATGGGAGARPQTPVTRHQEEITKLPLGRDRPSDAPPQLSLVEPGPERQKGPPDCPHLHVLALWAEVLPQLPQHEPEQWKGQRADHLRARWREVATAKGWPGQDAGIAYLRRLFAYVGRSPFLTGRVTPRDPNKRPFVVTLAWLVKPENWAKTVEGEYHEESA